MRITARVLRFIQSTRNKIKYQSAFISHDEYLSAQAIWIKYHQSKYFFNELETLKSNSKSDVSHANSSGVGRDSCIAKMTPFIDGDGIMRVGGRIKHSLMSFDTKHPIILSNNCRFSHLLALEAHKRTLHGMNQLCMQYIRQRFWLTNIRKVIKKVTLKCIPCFRQRKEAATQLMGDLPSTRVRPGFAFESVGVDYCGR